MNTAQQEDKILRAPTGGLLPIKLTAHKTNPTNDLMDIIALDEPGPGGAHHQYVIYWPMNGQIQAAGIRFQRGPIKEAGVNGLTQEALLAIVIHRLECFQNGEFACQENQDALNHIRNGLEVLKARTLARQARGVEGTNQK